MKIRNDGLLVEMKIHGWPTMEQKPIDVEDYQLQASVLKLVLTGHPASAPGSRTQANMFLCWEGSQHVFPAEFATP